MNLNQINEPVFTSKDLIQEIYKGNLDKLTFAKVSQNDLDYISYLEFIEENNLLDWPCPEPYLEINKSQKEYDSSLQSKWFVPDNINNFNIEEYLYSLCISSEEKDRVILELDLYKKYNMIPLLRFLKYLVDVMRENNILWGVGRGSSVASYCLYLLGVHKINSIKYELDIREFLK